MNIRRIIGVVLIVLGVCLLGTSYYIKGEVLEGREKISSAQGKVDATNKLFSVSPSTKSLGDRLTGGAQGKIDEGKQEVEFYSKLALQLQVGGYIAIFLGLIFLIGGIFRKKS